MHGRMHSAEGTSRQPQQRWLRAIIWRAKHTLRLAKKKGEGPNYKALLHSMERLDSAFGDLGDDSTDADSVVLKSLVKTMKARPLDLADNFKINKGVPTFTWTDPLQLTSFHAMALSSDRTRMVFVEDEQKICVYDLLDNFRLIAESQECFNGVNCVAFPKAQNDVVIAVYENSTVSFLSVPMDDPEAEGHSTMELLPKKLQVIEKKQILPQYNYLDKVFSLIACHTSESWVFASDPSTPNELNLISVTKQDYRKIKIANDEGVRSCATFMSIPHKALMSVVETEANSKVKVSRIWKGIDFEKEVIQGRLIELEGQGMELSDCGKYFLVWGDQQRRQSVLGLYDIEALDVDSHQPMSSKLLPDDILDVKTELLDRNSIEFNHVDLKCGDNVPIVALLVSHRKKVSLTFWDPHRDETLKQVEFTTRSMVWSPDMKLEFRLSPNMKWIVIGGWSKGRFALFSVVSKRLVWDADFLDEELAPWPYSAFEFDASCTKLMVNCSNKLYAFAPPCLIEDYQIEVRGAKYELNANNNNNSLLSPLTWEHRRFLSKEVLKRVMITQLGLRTKECINSFDAALSKISTTVAILAWRKSPPLLLVGSLDAFSSKPLWKYITNNFAPCPRQSNIHITNVSECLSQLEVLQRNASAALFLYPDQERLEDHIVIFALKEGLLAAFKDSSNTWTQPVSFSSEQCFQIRQSNDGHRIICAMPSGVMIIDLNRRQTSQFVQYDAKMPRLVFDYSPSSVVDSPNGLGDRDVVLDINEDVTRDPLVNIHTHDREAEEPTRVGCFCVAAKSHSSAAYLEFKKSKMTPTALSLVNSTRLVPEENQEKRICRKEWNLHTRNMMDSLSQDDLHYCIMQFDEGSGHLWFIGITKEGSRSFIVFVPFGPYSLDDCVPNLYMKDYPRRIFTMTELERLLHTFGDNFLTMTFNNKSNCDIVLEEKCEHLGLKISVIADKEESVLSKKFKKRFHQSQCDEYLTSALAGNDYEWVKQCLDVAITERHNDGNATLIKKCFLDLWKKFPSLVISILEEDKLVTKICDIEIDATVFKSNDHLRARIGTCDSVEDWIDASQRGTSFDYWKKINKKNGIQVLHSGDEATTKASLEVFYLDDVCKVGKKGIVRFLLMHNAPSYIFKSPLLKWVIVFKWEMIWRRRSVVNCVIYLFYVGAFSTYSICIGLHGESLENMGIAWAYLSFLLCVTCSMALYMAYKGVVQLITCCNDGEELFRNRLHGLKSYFSSLWNLNEVISYILLFVVFCLHVICLHSTSSTLPFLYTCSAIELLLMCIKIWYHAQPFKKTGALVLLVENVIRDSVPFLLLTLGVLIGFGFAMFAVFQSILYKLDFDEDNETKIAIEHEFGNPTKSMLTLFYAMVGVFDATFFLDCGLWSILVITIFVLYLSMQLILMLNMLIALMSDTFDRVKSTEEEQLLLGRARFIDACEAQLTKKQIENIERKVHKWLYILSPVDRIVSEDARLWQGRVSTIADRVEKSNKAFRDYIVDDIKKEIDEKLTHLHQEIETLKSDSKSVLHFWVIRVTISMWSGRDVKDEVCKTQLSLQPTSSY